MGGMRLDGRRPAIYISLVCYPEKPKEIACSYCSS